MDILVQDMELIKKILNKEIDVNQVSKEEISRIIKLCQNQNDNLNRRIAEKEKTIAELEKKIEKYNKN